MIRLYSAQWWIGQTGLHPIRTRRVILSLIYLLDLPPHQYAHKALQANIDLLYGGKLCWLQDLCIALNNIPGLDIDSELAIVAADHCVQH